MYMISKEDLIQISGREIETTLRVMKAFPEDNMEFRPHERSSDARKLMSTFVFEMYLLDSYVFGTEMDGSRFMNYKPEKAKDVIEDFEKETGSIMSKLRELSPEDLSKKIEFGGRTFLASEFVLMMILDQIHHRGQLSVYIRMAGGKVPSIYGPSADDNSTNL